MRTRRSQSSGNPMSRTSSARAADKGHQSVLLHESIEALEIAKDDIVVDATLGGAGHSKAIVDLLGSKGMLIGLDADSDAIERAKVRLSGSKARLEFINGNFKDLQQILESIGVEQITKALFDLGWSSFQLDAGRGFSFQTDEPLLMTYAKEPNGLTASTIVNTWAESSLADVIYGWGDERYSRRIAKGIVAARAKKNIETARELAEVIKASVPAPYRFGRLHPATKTFQALRIAVNDELGALKSGITAAWRKLVPGGRIAVITFHSIEDREVKELFAEFVQQGGIKIPKKPIKPSLEELQENPRARSAKLRVIQKNL
ncbi:MAG: 16S rRNA (cytosine(1402)-N(4))-methyltransferase RsmH [Candidatus Pacebacteria bacterium]|nr:16S rRNA (cytosine(1402)-N(4))-methyltransferase RsmH [Candidatus Paceibacterota bacterium]